MKRAKKANQTKALISGRGRRAPAWVRDLERLERTHPGAPGSIAKGQVNLGSAHFVGLICKPHWCAGQWGVASGSLLAIGPATPISRSGAIL